MKNLKITKILLTLFLALGLTTSSFAMGQGEHKEKQHDKVKIEQKINKQSHKKFVEMKKPHKQEVQIVKVYTTDNHKHHKHHDKRHCCNTNDLVAKCIGTGICLTLLSAINS